MGGFLTSLLGPVIGGIFGASGQNATNQANAAQAKQAEEFSASEAQKNRDYQTQMSNTSWQRGVADIKAAGLNPALAYQQGGASSPSGSTASGQAARMDSTVGAGISSAAQAASVAADVKQKMAQTDLTNAQAGQIRTMLASQLAKTQADADLSSASAGRQRVEAANVSDSFSACMANLQADWEKSMASAQQIRGMVGMQPMQSELLRLSIPAARNLSNAANTLWGRYVTPFIGDAKSISQTLNPFLP